LVGSKAIMQSALNNIYGKASQAPKRFAATIGPTACELAGPIRMSASLVQEENEKAKGLT
jgi:hypothetical protein